MQSNPDLSNCCHYNDLTVHYYNKLKNTSQGLKNNFVYYIFVLDYLEFDGLC